MFRKIAQKSQFLKKSSFKTQKLTVLNNKRSYAKRDKKSAAVLLSGCGYLDGSEVTESVAAILQLRLQGYNVDCYAPKLSQETTFDHEKGTLEKNEIRKVSSEASRIARKLQPWKKLKAKAYNILVVPGGFGVGRNLSSFADDGVDFKVNDDVKEVLVDFHTSKKPIGLICIAPILAANIFGTKNGGAGCKITFGNDSEASDAATKLGATVIEKSVNEICIDKENSLLSTPAYMDPKADPLAVFKAVGKMIEGVNELDVSVMESASLGKDVLTAIDKLTQGKPESHKKWWVEKIQKGEEKVNEQTYKSTVDDPKNWTVREFL